MTKPPAQQKFIYWIYSIAVLIFSLLLIAYAFDISNGNSIDASTTQKGRQDILLIIATFLGTKGSIIVGTLATGIAIYMTIIKNKTN